MRISTTVWGGIGCIALLLFSSILTKMHVENNLRSEGGDNWFGVNDRRVTKGLTVNGISVGEERTLLLNGISKAYQIVESDKSKNGSMLTINKSGSTLLIVALQGGFVTDVVSSSNACELEENGKRLFGIGDSKFVVENLSPLMQPTSEAEGREYTGTLQSSNIEFFIDQGSISYITVWVRH